MKFTNTRSCRACKRPIAFIKSAISSRYFVVDPDPVVITADAICSGKTATLNLIMPDGRTQRGNFGVGEYGYIDHHATCTHPNQFRKKT